MKKNNNKGFTLAELLIVVAIIAVLVAIAIPIFNSQLEKAREATDVANIRDAYAEIAVAMIDGGLTKDGDTIKVVGTHTATLSGSGKIVTVAGMKVEQKVLDNWAIGNPTVAGVTINTLPTAATTNVVFTFAETTNATTGAKQTYLSTITFTA